MRPRPRLSLSDVDVRGPKWVTAGGGSPLKDGRTPPPLPDRHVTQIKAATTERQITRLRGRWMIYGEKNLKKNYIHLLVDNCNKILDHRWCWIPWIAIILATYVIHVSLYNRAITISNARVCVSHREQILQESHDSHTLLLMLMMQTVDHWPFVLSVRLPFWSNFLTIIVSSMILFKHIVASSRKNGDLPFWINCFVYGFDLIKSSQNCPKMSQTVICSQKKSFTPSDNCTTLFSPLGYNSVHGSPKIVKL